MRRYAPLLLMLGLVATAQAADAPLHLQIDQTVNRGGIGIQSARCDDATFVRRVYLDLVNGIPSAEEARAFITDTDPDKRRKLVDKLIADDRFNRRLVNFFDVMLMERRADKNVKVNEWRTYLLESMRANKPFNQLAAEVIGSDGADAKLRPAAKFFLDRDSEPNLMTRDISRMFFGMDLQCAQCHDHPLVDDYYQRDYYGIYAFVNRTYVYDDKKAKKKLLAEKAEGEVDFKSVFTEQSGFARPRLPGEPSLSEPTFDLGEEYKVKAAKDVRPIPHYSRRQMLAERIKGGANEAFSRNIANRLWKMVMGRGIVEPVDLHHTGNPPSNPELLSLLSRSMREGGYDVKRLIRELVLTETYQRALQTPTNLAQRRNDTQKVIDQIGKIETQLKETAKHAEVAYLTLLESVSEARANMLPVRAERDKAHKAWAAAKKKADAAAKPVVDATAKRDAEKKVVDALTPLLTAAAAAAKSLPEDKSLAEVLTKLKARHAKHSAQLASQEKALMTQTAALGKAKSALDAAAKTFVEQRAKLEDLDEKSRQLEAKLSESELKRRDLVLLERKAAQRMELARGHLAALEIQSTQNARNAEKLAAEAKAGTLKVSIEKQQVAVKQSVATLPNMQQQVEQAEQQMGTMRTAMEDAEEKRRVIADLATKIAAVKARLNDEHLNAAAGLIESRRRAAEDATQAAKEALAAQQTAVQNAIQQLDSAKKKISALEQEAARLAKAQQAAIAERTKLTNELQKLEPARNEAMETLIDALSQHHAIAQLKPLTPEQMAWSMMQMGGMIERQVVASKNELNKKKPLSKEAQADPAKVAEREAEARAAAYTKLLGSVAPFVKLYGGGAGQPQSEFFATVDQALFASNGGQMRSWFSVAASVLSKETDAGKLAEQLYLTVLTRFPSADERTDVAGYLKGRDKDRKAAVEEMIWALATSVEFRFGH